MSSQSEFVEYQPPGEEAPWQVEDWEGLAKEFALKLDQLPEFHAIAKKHSGPWRVARMLFGVNPVIPAPGTDVGYLRCFKETEIAKELDCDKKQVRPQLCSIETAWARHQMSAGQSALEVEPIKPPPAKPQPTQPPQPAPSHKKKKAPTAPPAQLPIPTPLISSPLPPPNITEEEIALLLSRGFTLDEFDLPDRSAQARDLELRWFIERLGELRKMFEEPMAKALARQAIVNELSTRRCDEEMMMMRPSDGDYWSIQETKNKIERIYKEQWEQLEEICPYIKYAVGKRTFAQVISEVVEAHRAWEGAGNRELIDGFFTATEIQIEMRQSQQSGPRYRPGLIAAIAEARAGLHDPNWCRGITDQQCKILDDAYRDANKRLVDSGAIALIDLEVEGPGAEYPPLFVSTKPIADPDDSDQLLVAAEEAAPLEDAPPAPAKNAE
jgi:hypothetical protein